MLYLEWNHSYGLRNHAHPLTHLHTFWYLSTIPWQRANNGCCSLIQFPRPPWPLWGRYGVIVNSVRALKFLSVDNCHYRARYAYNGLTMIMVWPCQDSKKYREIACSEDDFDILGINGEDVSSLPTFEVVEFITRVLCS